MMLSRTSARQQRMRHQTLNEERMAQSINPPRSSAERRSSGSKLIISSPSPSSNLTGHSLPLMYNTIGDGNVKHHQTVAHGLGGSALLAFLGGSERRQIPATPIESCFDNIEDQGSDSFDLNNINPSIHLSPSVGLSEELLSYPGHASSADDQQQQQLHVENQTRLGIRITHGNGQDLLHVSHLISESEEDDSPIKASTSCPAEMEDDLHPLESSPFQVGSYGTHMGTSGSGGSLGTTDAADGLGGGGSGSLSGAASVIVNPGGSSRYPDNHRTAWIRDRSKKDSHNRIERKRRDYINCQISELGSLLPEEMFRDGDCKKNKGSILKNSVEFICMLRAELAQVPDVQRETSLAAQLIEQLVKRVQELESLIGQRVPNQRSPGSADYQRCFQEWLFLHEYNLRSRACFSPSLRPGFLHSTDAPASSPGPSSLGTDELQNTESKVVLSGPRIMAGSAPAPSAPLTTCMRLNSPMTCGVLGSRNGTASDSPFRIMRQRCTSLIVAGTGIGSGAECGSPTSLRLLPTDQQPHNPPHHPRLLPPQIVSSPARSLHVTHAPFHDQSTPSSRVSVLPSQSRPWQSQSPYAQKQVSPRQLFTHHQHTLGSKPIGVIAQYDGPSRPALSASLPVNASPLLCGLQDRERRNRNDTGTLDLYSFERDDFVSHLKSEPPFETDPRPEDLRYPDPSPPTLNITSSQFEALVASAPSQSLSDPRGAGAQTGTRMILDSPSNTTFESDEFRFDDVPME